MSLESDRASVDLALSTPLREPTRFVPRLTIPSAVSELVLVFPLLPSELCDSASPRQNHPLVLPVPGHHESLRAGSP